MPTSSQSPNKAEISGLPRHSENDYAQYYRDIHMDTAKGFPPSTGGLGDIHMNTAKGLTFGNDIRMDTAKASTSSVSTIKQSGLPLKDREIVESSEVKRKATVAQLCGYRAVCLRSRLSTKFYRLP